MATKPHLDSNAVPGDNVIPLKPETKPEDGHFAQIGDAFNTLTQPDGLNKDAAKGSGGNAGWFSELHMSGGDNPHPLNNLHNALHALRQAPEWQSVYARNAFADQRMVMQPPPWVHVNKWKPRELEEADYTMTTVWLHAQGMRHMRRSDVVYATEAVAHENSFNPVEKWFDALRWDKIPRLHLLPEKFGVVKSVYSVATFRKFMVATVARAKKPGAKVDTAMVLESQEQGPGKSRTIAALCPVSTDYFTDEMPDLRSKDAGIQLQGMVWVEFGELGSMKRADADSRKAHFSRSVDRYRGVYERNAKNRLRTVLAWITTNPSAGWHTDETGGRRFWPHEVIGKIDHKWIVANREQLWAEAVAAYGDGSADSVNGGVNGEHWWIDDEKEPDLAKAQAEEMAKRYVGDAWSRPVMAYVQKHGAAAFTVANILCFALKMRLKDHKPLDAIRVAAILREAKWVRHRPRPEEGGGRDTYWFRPGAKLPPVLRRSEVMVADDTFTDIVEK